MPSTIHDDQELSRKWVQSLSSADALVGLLERLNYPVETRLPLTAEALGLSEELSRAARRIERLVSVEAGALEIYLFELKSVTVSRTRALARAFRERAGNYLLVLTDDYDRIDFVLLERVLPETGQSSRSRKGITLRPRVFTVDRRAPGPVAIRVLRRFTLTEFDAEGEPDPYAQFDKLRSAYGVAEWSEPLFNNRALFSDYYLNERLPALPEWKDPARTQAYRELRRLMAAARRLKGKDQAGPTLRREMIQPLLETLGFQVEAVTAESGPDFRLTLADSPAASSHTPFVLAYPWGRYLDGKDENRDRQRPEENPGAQAVSLLEAGEAPWAIVTNGKIWRLYSAQAHSRATNYYEIDLEETIASPAPADAFRYFYLFFRAAAFAPEERQVGGESRRLSFLDWLLEESAIYARELGERLKERVFEEIFPHLAAGFIEGAGGSRALLALPEADRTARLDDIFQATLTFLYRLLFLLYAESRDLLPVREVRGYHQVSLQRFKEEVAGRAKTIEDEAPANLNKAYSATETGLYERLLGLFQIIDRGDPARNVPIYNGGLFITTPVQSENAESRTARFLQETKIPDRHLALGLDRLARDLDPKRGDLVFIDYKSLGVRQLGSIYEGLLEFKLRLAAEPMAVVKGKKTEEVIPQAEAERRKLTPRRLLPPGAAYLENDRRERKATGSYYTPDYIVKYIVRHTVGPVLDEKFEALRPRLRQVESRFRQAVERKQVIERVAPDKPALLTDIAGEVLRDLFDLKVLDPAMGSGHFLVEAVDYITDRLVRFVEGFPFLSHFFDGMRRDILAEMERQAVSIDPARLTDVTLLKRHVLKRCIYGVDLNRMAVELAKVSLWLDCFTLGAPLSFLDHHLRWGNSLIGASARQAEAEMAGPGAGGQMTFLTGPFVGLLRAAEIMRGISFLTDVTMTEVEQSEQLFREFDRAARPYKQLLDVYVARHFGVERADEFLRLYGVEALTAEADNLDRPYRKVLAETRRLYEEKRFFHWDLEFPEVFIDLERADWKPNGGFDAVVGNPPYVRIQNVSKDDVAYFAQKYATPGGDYDIYVIFVEAGLNLLRLGTNLGFIIPHKFIETRYGAGLRRLIQEQANIVAMVDFGDAQVFGDAITYPCILILQRASHFTDPKYIFLPEPETLSYQDTTLATVPRLLIESDVWQLRNYDVYPLLKKIRGSHSILLGELTQPHYSLFTGLNEAFVVTGRQVDEFSIEKSILRPLLRGQDIDRWLVQSEDLWIIYPYTKDKQDNLVALDLLQYPGAKGWLEQYRNKLVNRKKFRSKYRDEQTRKSKWYHFIDPRSPEQFDQTKILFPEIASKNTFALDTESFYCLNKIFCINLELEKQRLLFLTSLLNSSTLDFYFCKIAKRLQNNYYEYASSYVAELPIRRIHFTTPEAERERRLAELMAHYEQGRDEALLAAVAGLLPTDEAGHFLAFAPEATGAEEQSDVVHDLLARLAQQMIDLNQQKQAEQKRYFAALEAALRISPDKKGRTGLDALSGKTYIWGYLGDYQKNEPETDWEQIEDTLFKNKRRIGANLSDPRLLARLRREYESSLAALRPLKTQLARTDALIDRVVYRLYGLAEEEIAVVEGRE